MNVRAVSVARVLFALVVVIALAPVVPCGAFAAGDVPTAGDDAPRVSNEEPAFTLSGSSGNSTMTTYKQNTAWKRVWGKTAPITMQTIAKEFGKAKVAIVTTDSSYKDALAASALAGKCSGPVLMTKKGSLTAQTKAALKAAGAKTVYIVGSTANVSATVERQLKSGTGVTRVVRVAGATPSQRAVAAAKVGGKKSDTVIVATQNGFQDALSIAPYSYAIKSPILYAEANKKLSAATVSYIKSAKYRKAIVVGGPIALPASIDSQLKSAGVTQVTRLAGANLYATSRQIANWTTGSLANGTYGTYKGKALAYVKFQPSVKLGANRLAVSTGQNWLDALAGAALCGKNKSVMLLADAKTAKSNYSLAVSYCAANKSKMKNAYVLGGTSAVQAKVWDALVNATKIAALEPVEAPTPVAFSLEPGSYPQDSISLELSSEANCEIRYTLDGSTPTASSALYDGPITLGNRTSEPSIIFSSDVCGNMVAKVDGEAVKPAPIDDATLPKANVGRAICIAKDGTTGPVATGTYFVGWDPESLYGGAPVISIVTDPDNLIDYEKGILVNGRVYDEWKDTEEAARILADESLWEHIQANYTQKKKWERPVSFEVFSGGKLGCAFDGGIRVKGGYSRIYGQRSFNVYLRDEYGQAAIDYPLIPTSTGYDSGVVSDFSSFTLRNGGNDVEFLKFKDAFIQSLVADRAFSTQSAIPAIVFLNGEYAGPYNLQEKIVAEFYAHHYGVDAENVVVIKEGELEEGEDEDFQLYENLMSYAGEDKDLGDPATWESFKAVMDVESMAEYYATEIYIGNWDWAQDKNTMLWRTRTASGESPYADGKWRFSLYDTDISTGIYGWDSLQASFDSFNRAVSQSDELVRHPLFVSALRNGEFRALFMGKLQDIGSTCFDSQRVNTTLDGFVSQWQPYIADSYKRFGNTSGNWYNSLSNMRTYFASRYDYIIGYAEAGMAAFE